MKKLIAIVGFFFITQVVIYAHPGRTDKNGGHNGPNGYHYHNGSGGTVGSSVPSPVIESNKAPENEDMVSIYTECRRILVANDVVKRLATWDDFKLEAYNWYCIYCEGLYSGDPSSLLGVKEDEYGKTFPAKKDVTFIGMQKLNDDDATLMGFIIKLEQAKRTMQHDDFLIFLEDQRDVVKNYMDAVLASKAANYTYFYTW
ncbi:hypothetical protein AGMMS4952_10960 [Spirochaetia bacterium]|nr:hypothetical protein AGMMS4952_10960 [Spirochaetia bacterium]